MSIHAGAFFFDGRPIDGMLLERLRRSVTDFGPDGRNESVQPGLAMLYGAAHVTPEDCIDQQPIVSRRGNIITWTGRLDNRGDLMFQLWDELRGAPSDSVLALASFERWGIEGFGRLIGDWSLAIWERSSNSVILATDYMSVRPLYYYVTPDSVTWSSTLHALVELYSLHNSLDDRYIVGYLSRALAPSLTPYRGIARVMAAHCSIASKGATRSRRYWEFPSHDLRYSDPRDYESELRRLFLDGVRQRLRSRGPVWSQLSGGLDSSCIACAADVLIKTGAAIAPALETVGYITDGSPESDERRFMLTVDAYTGSQTHLLQLDGAAGTYEYSWVTPTQPSPMLLRTFDMMAQSGSRVLLTGLAGDSVLGNFLDYHYDVAGRLQEGRLASALVLARKRALGDKTTIFNVLRRSLVEFAPTQMWMSSSLDHEMRASGASSATTDGLADLYLLKPAYTGLIRAEWERQLRRLHAFPNVSVRRPMRHLFALGDGIDGLSPSEVRGITETHPYLHRPLVEFAMAIPMEVLAPPGNPRGLMRQAFRSFVPPRILQRFSKGYASPFIARAKRGTWSEWLARPSQVRLLTLNCIDGDRFMKYLVELRDGTSRRGDFITVLARLEQWLRLRELAGTGIERERVG